MANDTGAGSTSQNSFSRTLPPSAVTPCVSCCERTQAFHDAFAEAVHKLMEATTGNTVQATGLVEGDFGPMMYAADASPCKRMAYENEAILRRYNRYREALPYAEAAQDMNALGDKAGAGNPPTGGCLTRLPDNATALCAQLKLPSGTIKPEDLRNDATGFRAALYRNEATGKLILVARDTQPTSLVDWETNIKNGKGLATDQYKAMRALAGRLSENNIKYDIAGYSKGGGLAQEAGLINTDPQARIFVFNSAGIPKDGDLHKGTTNMNLLRARTRAFSAQDDFLTFINETTDPDQIIENAEFLLRELKGENRLGLTDNADKIKFAGDRLKITGAAHGSPILYLIGYFFSYVGSEIPKKLLPMKIDHYSPGSAGHDGNYNSDLKSLFDKMDESIQQMKKDRAEGKHINGFPPVNAAQKEVINNSRDIISDKLNSNSANPNLGKLNQHLISNVVKPMKSTMESDRKSLEKFLTSCGGKLK